ncbi:branched-chain amino acid ABC transporter permease [Halorubellus sp. JP-L1]|uniref:branched-chain amino acid ABC transporter permease n=1 Tax=Halorubellus sp. JP-L1 TaxID=2715753 RepID=UPI0014096A04|nr:branched-chain amino acid ABC transporter permease [Halorubellus sp. JP-L1]NHN42478.1 branched-chain amino acid ABC transporter permease [Halorubellus sp. JP-L1]
MVVDVANFATHTLNGIQYGFILFLIASGLTIILGILDVLNLAHGELYAVGAYVAFSVYGYATGLVAAPEGVVGLAVFLVVALLAAAVAAAVLIPLGVLLEALFLRPLYGRDEVYQLVLTFGLLLILKDVNKFIWGPLPVRAGDVYSGINAIPAAEFVGLNFPTFKLVIIAVGALVVVGLFYFFNRTKMGRIIRATAIDREMATAIGVSTDRTFTLVFAMGAFFAGFAGAMALPQSQANLEMGANPLVLSFVVIVIGGLGSLRGAFVGAMLVGVLSRWAVWQYPPAEIAAPFAIMALILLVKPNGLFGTWGETA